MTIPEQAEQVYRDLMAAPEPADTEKDIAILEAALRECERVTWEAAKQLVIEKFNKYGRETKLLDALAAKAKEVGDG